MEPFFDYTGTPGQPIRAAAGGVAYDDATLHAILELPEVLGIKVATLDSVMTFQRIAALMRSHPDKLLITGEDRFYGYSVMAGATGMRARAFFPLITLGAVGRISAIYFVGDWLEEPLTDVSHFIAKYALYLTPITIAITVFQVVMSRRKGRGLPIGTLDELEEDFAETEA